MTAEQTKNMYVPKPNVEVVIIRNGLKLSYMKNKKWTASDMGKRGGKNRAKNLSKERRSEIARMGGLKRWSKVIHTPELDDKNTIC